MIRLHEVIQEAISGEIDLDEVTAIVQAEPDEVNSTDLLNNTSLHYAAASGKKPLVQLLLNLGADVNAKGDLGKTPLHYAAMEQESGVVRLLVKRNADIDCLDEMGFSPLHLTVQGHIEPETTARALLKFGAFVEANAAIWLLNAKQYRTRLKQVPDLIRKAPQPDRLLRDAVIKGDVELVELLIEEGVSVDGIPPTDPPIFSAFTFPIILKLLLVHKAQVNIKNSFGQTPLQWAKEMGLNHKTISLLKSYGAK